LPRVAELASASDARFIIDIKHDSDSQFVEAASEIFVQFASQRALESVAVQAYSIRQVEFLLSLGFPHFLYATWKILPSDDDLDVFESMVGLAHTGGLTAPAYLFQGDANQAGSLRSRLTAMLDSGVDVWIHGQAMSAERNLLDRGFGLFVHDV
jgi:hypothetical protein